MASNPLTREALEAETASLRRELGLSRAECVEAKARLAAASVHEAEAIRRKAALLSDAPAERSEPAEMPGWKLLSEAPRVDNYGRGGVDALVWGQKFGTYYASRVGVTPWGDAMGSMPSHHGTLTDWGITHWMPLPSPPKDGSRG